MPPGALTAAVSLLAAAFADPAPGRAILEGKGGCLECHSIGNRGGVLAPDLSDIGAKRDAGSLRLSLVDPDAEIEPEYVTIVATTSRGERVEGVRLNEDDFSIQLRDASANLRSFLKAEMKGLTRELRSLMPSYAAKLNDDELAHLVRYLSSLKGPLTPGSEPRRPIASVSENLEWLTRPDRDGDERPTAVLDALRIPAGAIVADVGAGAGYFTWRLAQRVGAGGKVYAVEVQQKMLDLISADLAKRGIANVQLVRGSQSDPGLPAGALDLVFLGSAYHEFSEPEAMMSAIRRSLKPNGRLVVLEYRKEDAYTYLEELHKMSLREIRLEIEAMGFQTGRILPFLPRQHFVIFEKRQP